MDEASTTADPITIVIADDHQVVRAGLRLLLEAEDGFEVVAEAGDVATTERRITAYHPRVLILDLNMPGESSLEAIPKLVVGVENHAQVGSQIAEADFLRLGAVHAYRQRPEKLLAADYLCLPGHPCSHLSRHPALTGNSQPSEASIH